MISQSRYIKIVSGVGAGAAVAERQLILRLMTQNNLLPPGIVGEFLNSDAVSAYFGSQSEEYKRSLAYFSFISKLITSPNKISFARWANTPIAATVVGDSLPKTLATFTAITAGTLEINTGASSPVQVTALDFSNVTDLTNVAAIMQTALQATADPQLTTSTVTFNTNTNQYVLTGATPGSGSIQVVATGQTNDVSTVFGWATTGTVNVPGQAADTPDVAVSKAANISDNFGSFAYCTPSAPLQNTDIEAISAWNDGQNNKFMYCLQTPLSNLGALYTLIKGYSGTAITLNAVSMPNDYCEQSPSEILASTNYNNPNSSQNYMYYQFPNRNVVITDDNTADIADASRGNYIGVTQEAGQQLAFYQRGVLTGGPTAAVDMNTYANEMWIKSSFTTAFFSLFLNVPEVPADPVGAAMLLGVMQPVIDQGKVNGVIAPGKPLSATQIQYITLLTNDANAWRQVQTLGYWVRITFTSQVNPANSLTEWIANYLFVYSKSDAIRAVNGSDVMI